MTFDINLKINLDDIADELDDIVLKQVPYAAFLALKDTVFKTARDVKKALPYFIQGGPVAFTARGVQFKKPPNKHTLHAEVFIPDEQWKYMQWVIDGGVKKWNRSEHGISMPVNVKFNKYGNIPGKKRKEGLWRGKLDSGGGVLTKKQFVGTIKGITGLWQRTGGKRNPSVKLLVSFSHDPVNYKGRFPFRKKVTEKVKKYFRPIFNKKLVDVVNRESEHWRVR